LLIYRICGLVLKDVSGVIASVKCAPLLPPGVGLRIGGEVIRASGQAKRAAKLPPRRGVARERRRAPLLDAGREHREPFGAGGVRHAMELLKQTGAKRGFDVLVATPEKLNW